MFDNLFNENRTVYETMSKNVVEQGYMHVCSFTRPRARILMQACTFRPITNTYCFSTATMIRERASMLRYTYIALLV